MVLVVPMGFRAKVWKDMHDNVIICMSMLHGIAGLLIVDTAALPD